MAKQERYTLAQQKFLLLKEKNLTDKDKEMLRVLLFPRGNYVPDDMSEGFELARMLLSDEEYTKFRYAVAEIEERYQFSGEWGKGDRNTKLYYRFRKNSKTYCSIGLFFKGFDFVIMLGKNECALFEKYRDSFPRLTIQWAYDCAAEQLGGKLFRIGLKDTSILQDCLRLLDLKCQSK